MMTTSMTLTVHRGGLATTVQDLGRPGFGRYGVPPSGAADRGALRRSNRLVGNDSRAAGLETLLGGLEFSLDGPAVVAVTGAAGVILIDGDSHPANTALAVPAHARVCLGIPSAGLRGYVAIRGGLAGPTLYGSRSAAPSLGLGTALVDGDTLTVGRAGTGAVELGEAPPPLPDGTTPVRLSALFGPRDDWFPAEAVDLFVGQTWRVSPDTDRVGVRLLGAPLGRRGGELPSEPVIRGSVQVPPSGEPIIFLADHPVTGGYPVIAVVDDPDTDVLAQCRPGQPLRFVARRATWHTPLAD